MSVGYLAIAAHVIGILAELGKVSFWGPLGGITLNFCCSLGLGHNQCSAIFVCLFLTFVLNQYCKMFLFSKILVF